MPRSIRSTFGGRALDRLIFEFDPTGDPSEGMAGGEPGADPSPDPGAAAGAAPAGSAPDGAGEPDTSAGATGAAPGWTPEQLEQLRDDPAFQDWLAEEAGLIADARLAQFAGQFQPQPEQGDGAPQIDVNEYLNPLSDNFGQNLVNVLNLMQQQIMQGVNQGLQPIMEDRQQQEGAVRDELLRSSITDAAGENGLAGGDLALERVMADVRNRTFPQFAARYGPTDRAAELAIQRAIQDEREYQRTIREAGVEEFKRTLSGVAGAPGEPAAGPAGAQGTHQVKIGQRVVDRYAAPVG